MTATKRLRYAGFILMAIAALLLLFFCSVTARNRYKAAPDQYAVLVITEDADLFPVTDYDVLFSNLNLSSSYCALDAGDSADKKTLQITDAINASGSEHVILLASGDAAMPALSASIGQTKTAAVLLLAPTLKQTDSMEAFGTASPSVRTAIFSSSSVYSSALYERLSGEDTTLFPGISSGGRISSTAFISPDAARYLEAWNLTGHESFDRTMLTLLPDSETSVGEYINNYVLPEEMRSDANLKNTDALFQVLKIIASASLLSGLLVFFASISRAARRENSPEGAASPFVREKDDAGISVLRRAAAGSFLVSVVAGVLVSATVLILYAAGFSGASAVLFGWPLLFYAIDAFFHFRLFTKTAALTRVPVKRFLLSASLMLFFLIGCGTIRFMYTAGLSHESAVSSSMITAGVILFLFFFTWMSDTAGSRAKTIGDSRLDALVHRRKIVLFVPFLAGMVLHIAKGEIYKAVLSTVIAVLLLLCLWIRGIFRRISGTDWGGAAAFSILYVITMII
jgi:hypothetical protein